MTAKTVTALGPAFLVGAAAALCADWVLGPNVAKAQSVTSNANYSTTVETTGAYGTSNFQAAGNAASSNTPSDLYPAFGVVAFNASSYTSLASTGVSPSITLTAYEYVSTSSSTGTQAGSVTNFYFAKSPATGTGLGDYDTTNEPGGFDAANFNADLVGSATYGNVANQVDTIPLTLSTGDVTYIDNALASGTGSFELIAVATTSTGSARYDGNYATSPATLTLDAAAIAASPEPTSMLLLAAASAPLALGRRRAKPRAANGVVP